MKRQLQGLLPVPGCGICVIQLGHGRRTAPLPVSPPSQSAPRPITSHLLPFTLLFLLSPKASYKYTNGLELVFKYLRPNQGLTFAGYSSCESFLPTMKQEVPNVSSIYDI